MGDGHGHMLYIIEVALVLFDISEDDRNGLVEDLLIEFADLSLDVVGEVVGIHEKDGAHSDGEFCIGLASNDYFTAGLFPDLVSNCILEKVLIFSAEEGVGKRGSRGNISKSSF